MPQRFLRPSIVSSLRLARCSPWAQLLFYKLINLVDDYDRYDAHPLEVARAAFPYGDEKGRAFKEQKIESLLVELENARLSESDEPAITRYTVRGKRCLLLHRCNERIRSLNSRYPSPAEDSACWQKLSEVVKCRQQSTNAASTPSSSPSSSSSVPYGEEATESNGAIASRTQFAALRAQVERLEAIPREARTLEQREELKKKRAELDALQKKQSERKFQQ